MGGKALLYSSRKSGSIAGEGAGDKAASLEAAMRRRGGRMVFLARSAQHRSLFKGTIHREASPSEGQRAASALLADAHCDPLIFAVAQNQERHHPIAVFPGPAQML